MRLRWLYGEWKSPIGVFRLGQMSNHWGMGLLANDGDHPSLFGDYRGGNLVEQVLFATKLRTHPPHRQRPEVSCGPARSVRACVSAPCVSPVRRLTVVPCSQTCPNAPASIDKETFHDSLAVGGRHAQN